MQQVGVGSTITNRVWANFFGVGLVEKVDDVRLTNPASNEQLLAAARRLVDSHYDLKALMRTILFAITDVSHRVAHAREHGG